jgi:hypothetical protein
MQVISAQRNRKLRALKYFLAFVIYIVVLLSAGAQLAGGLNPDMERHGSITAPYTSSVGRVRPPGRPADRSIEHRIEQRTPDQIRDDLIIGSICVGCD